MGSPVTIILFTKKLTHKYTKSLEFSARVGTITHLIKRTGVVHDSKTIRNVIKCHIPTVLFHYGIFSTAGRDITLLITLL